MINIKVHLKILRILSVRNPMEYGEDFLKYNVIVLVKCLQDQNGLLIEDFKKEEKHISWKKIIAILKFFMAKNKEEEIKMACCKIFLLLVKHQYYDDLVIHTLKLDIYGQNTFQVFDEGDPGQQHELKAANR